MTVESVYFKLQQAKTIFQKESVIQSLPFQDLDYQFHFVPREGSNQRFDMDRDRWQCTQFSFLHRVHPVSRFWHMFGIQYSLGFGSEISFRSCFTLTVVIGLSELVWTDSEWICTVKMNMYMKKTGCMLGIEIRACMVWGGWVKNQHVCMSVCMSQVWMTTCRCRVLVEQR